MLPLSRNFETMIFEFQQEVARIEWNKHPPRFCDLHDLRFFQFSTPQSLTKSENTAKKSHLEAISSLKQKPFYFQIAYVTSTYSFQVIYRLPCYLNRDKPAISKREIQNIIYSSPSECDTCWLSFPALHSLFSMKVSLYQFTTLPFLCFVGQNLWEKRAIDRVASGEASLFCPPLFGPLPWREKWSARFFTLDWHVTKTPKLNSALQCPKFLHV